VLKVLEIISTEFTELHAKLQLYKGLLEKALENAGFITTHGKAPITSIISGNTEATLTLAKELYKQGILTTPFIAPSVPLEEGRVRLIAGANLQEASIVKAVVVIAQLNRLGDQS